MPYYYGRKLLGPHLIRLPISLPAFQPSSLILGHARHKEERLFQAVGDHLISQVWTLWNLLGDELKRNQLVP